MQIIMNNVYKKIVREGVTFTNIKDDRFKTSRLSFNMFTPIKIDTVCSNAILPFMLRHSSLKHKSFTSINRRLAELYGASIYADVRKIGEVQVTSLSAIFLDDRYALDGSKVSDDVTDMLCELLFFPNLKTGEFQEDDIAQEKRQLIENIESEYNDKRLYARIRCEELMCRDEAYGINILGSKEEAQRLDTHDIYAAWWRGIIQSRIEIVLLGNTNGEKVYNKFKELFRDLDRYLPPKCETSVVKSADTVKTYHEMSDISQAKLVMGFRTGNDNSDAEVDATRLMCALFGETPQSKLFLNVREKLGLCYYCSSSFHKEKAIMFVQSGVDGKNVDKARDEILKQLDSIREGDFDDEQLESIKLNLSNALISLTDNLASLESWYLSQALDDHIKSPEEKVQDIFKISKQQVVEAAKKVTLDTVYSLTGGRNEQND